MTHEPGRVPQPDPTSTTLDLAPCATQSLTILIVDDERQVRRAVKRQLLLEGHTVLEAESGSDALTQLEQNAVDIIFLDVMMPQGNGLETLRAINEMARRPKCVLMSGKASLLHKAVLRGADWVLSKPFSRAHLLSALKTLAANINPSKRFDLSAEAR